MSSSDMDDAAIEDERGEQAPRRARWPVAVGIAATVLGLVGLVITEPATGQDLAQPRLWAIGMLLLGLIGTALALVARAWPNEGRPSSPPRALAWLLLLAAGCGLVALIATVRMGREDPMAYLSPTLLTVYPLVIYGYQSWRYRRSREADARKAPRG